VKRLRRHCCIIALLILTGLAASSTRLGAQSSAIGIYYVGPQDAVARAIDFADPYIVRVAQPDLAQVIVINNPLMTESVTQALEAFGADAQQGRVGMVIFCGPLFPQTVQDLRDILGVSTFDMSHEAVAAGVRATSTNDPLQHAIAWTSAPEVAARTVITNPNLLQSIVAASDHGSAIQRVRGRDRGRATTQMQTWLVGPWFGHPSNDRWSQWAYFDYLVYRLIADAAGTPAIVSFADYPNAPTPQRTTRLVIGGAGMALVLGAGLVYTTARRRLYLSADLSESWRRLSMLSPTRLDASGWRHVGFHRPLAGFLAFLPWSLILYLPLAIYSLHLAPDLLSAGTAGLDTWENVTRWTVVVWILLDVGTGAAAVRHFSARFDHHPRQAVRFLQFYVWWQLLSGAVQVGLVCLTAMLVLPAAGMAHLAYPILARAVLQVPGFLGVFSLTFRARQRFSSEQFLNLLYIAAVPCFQTAMVLLLRSWTERRPETAQGVAVLLGLAGGILLAEGLAFVMGAYLHRRDGQALSAIFLPTFDAGTVSEMMAFGIPWAISAAIPAATALLQTQWASTAIGRALIPADLGLESWQMLILVTTGFEILLIGFYNDLMPALTEAAALQTKTLLRYYVSQGVRYGAWFSLFLFAALGALGASMLPRTLTERYAEAWVWLMPMLAWGALRWTAWLPDRMLEAAGHPGLMMVLTLMEHIVRLGFAFFLTPMWGAGGLMMAYLAALLLRSVLGRLVAGQHLVRIRLYSWQSLLAPAVAGALLYSLLRAIQTLRVMPAGEAPMIGTIMLLLFSLPVYAFFTALFGGWDDGSLTDLLRATKLSGVGYPFAWVIYHAVRLGTSISPLHGRYPVGLHALAQKEALTVTALIERET
jgi:O-antigen/teichoic acid export membrane protein